MSSDSKYSFFRHSGWMVMATFLGGIFMAGVQIVALHDHVMEDSDYTDLIVLLGLLMLLGAVPSAALQTIFAQQSAAALTEETGELTASVRALLRATFIFWLASGRPGVDFCPDPFPRPSMSTIRWPCA